MRKIIFLDIDGVLNTEQQQWKCQIEGIPPADKFGYTFDPKAVYYLGEILNITDTEIVLSSSWKFLGMSVLQDMWQARRLPGTITDITPDNQEGKGLEIKEWLEKQQNDIDNYVILDDEDVALPEQQVHFVKCNPQFGVNKKVMEAVLRVFG